ncbi:MAG: tRNA-dihydrouridine synthase [Treponema sp.]|nr:tRNA-dihydrouridine synthase [Treponema sp.]
MAIGPLTLAGNLFLAPVAGYTDRAFRTLCVELGADFSFTELISCEALRRKPALYGLGPDAAPGGPERSAQAGLSCRGGAAPYAIQVFAAESEALYEAVSLLAPLRPDALDINAGCPVPKVVKTGAGAALMRDPALLGRMVGAAVRASERFLGGIPVTVKLRSGWDAGSINYRDCARAAASEGAAMLSLHPRTRAQGYAGESDWALIADLAAVQRLPVTGSGGLFRPEDAARMLRETGCAAVMFARGAAEDPFIFPAARALLRGVPWQAPSAEERIAAAFRLLRLKAADCGERRACLEMRKQFCALTRGALSPAALASGVRLSGAELRTRLVHAETIADYEAIMAPTRRPRGSYTS